MSERLKDKVAIVIGAGSSGPGWGNGKAISVLYAREGARVFAVDVRAEAAEETSTIIKTEGGDAISFRADVSQSDDVKVLVQHCLGQYGRIDICSTT